MSPRGKKKTTMAKLTRESRLRERRREKEARKEARRHAATVEPAHPSADPVQDQGTPQTDS
jgi:hypothetical protein